MKYDALEEQRNLQIQYPKLETFISLLTNDIAQIFQACQKNSNFDFQRIMAGVRDNTLSKLIIELERIPSTAIPNEELLAIKTSNGNIQSLLQNPDPSIMTREEAKKIVENHINNIIKRILDEKESSSFLNVLEKATTEDAKKRIKGELSNNIENSQTYQVLKTFK